jgi:hypothetical protein
LLSRLDDPLSIYNPLAFTTPKAFANSSPGQRPGSAQRL